MKINKLKNQPLFQPLVVVVAVTTAVAVVVVVAMARVLGAMTVAEAVVSSNHGEDSLKEGDVLLEKMQFFFKKKKIQAKITCTHFFKNNNSNF